MTANRGGLTLKSGWIGRVNVLRQQLLMPGERMDVKINGQVRLESLRERDSTRINAHLACFMTPVRWLWSEWPDFVKEGPDSVRSVPTYQTDNLARLGLGAKTNDPELKTYPQFFRKSVERVYNEWYKWPENSDITWTSPLSDEPAVPLSKAWSRARYNATPTDTEDYTSPAVSTLDVRQLAETQARYRSAMKREVLSYERWMELVKDTWRGDGSREVDQVPMLIDSTEVGVSPRDMPATDGPSLGTWQSLFDFNINHSIKSITAPEHCVLTYILVIRFAPIIEGVHPLTQDTSWHSLVADPEWYSAAQPESVKVGDVSMLDSDTELGFLPAGWRWRSDHDVIGPRIDEQDSFPYMLIPTTQGEGKDATRIKNAFRSKRFGHYVADVYFHEKSRQPIGDSMDSYFSGMVDHTKNVSRKGEEFPRTGKVI